MNIPSREEVESWTPGRRTYYKMMRCMRRGFVPWDNEPQSIRDAYEGVAASNPDLVPTIAEILERDAEMQAVRAAGERRSALLSAKSTDQ